jgi:pyruvate formate lyase activating enzyme
LINSGKVSCIIFTAGCNFRCGYCHNPEFVLPELLKKIKDSFIPESAALNFLKRRHGLLDGVVISGGEPTMQPDLIEFIKKIKRLGYAVKLDTNGNRPEVLRQLLKEHLVDYVAMDYKTSGADYQALVGPLANREKISHSRDLLIASNIPYEFRTTLIKEVHSDILLAKMAEELRGAKQLFLQSFRPQTTLNPAYGAYHAFTSDELYKIAELFRATIPNVKIRS